MHSIWKLFDFYGGWPENKEYCALETCLNSIIIV